MSCFLPLTIADGRVGFVALAQSLLHTGRGGSNEAGSRNWN
jgi:hypothetical protein